MTKKKMTRDEAIAHVIDEMKLQPLTAAYVAPKERDVIDSKLRQRKPLSNDEADWLADELESGSSKAGKKIHIDGRELVCVQQMLLLKRAGFPVFEGTPSEHNARHDRRGESAAHIVAEALNRAYDIAVEPSWVKNIWYRSQHRQG